MVTLDTMQISVPTFTPLNDLSVVSTQVPDTVPMDDLFRVVHDDPNFAIVFDGENYTGQLTFRQGMKLSRKVRIAASYGLVIEDVHVSEPLFATVYLRPMTAEELKEVS